MAPASAVTTAPTTTATTTIPAATDSKQDLDTATAEWHESEYNDAEFYDDAEHEEEQWDEGQPHAGNDNTAEEAYDGGAGDGDEDWDYYEEDYGGEEGLDPDAPVDVAAAVPAVAGDSTPTTTATTMFDGLLEDGVKIGSEEKAGNKPPLSAQQKEDSLPQRPQPAPALPARPHPPPPAPQQHQQQQHQHPANYRAHAHGPRPAGGYMPPQAHYDQFRPYGNRPPLPFHGGAKIHVNPKFAAAAATGRFHPYAGAPLPGAGAHHHHQHHAAMHAYPQHRVPPGIRGGGGGGGGVGRPVEGGGGAGRGVGMMKGGPPRGATAYGQPPHNRIYPPPSPANDHTFHSSLPTAPLSPFPSSLIPQQSPRGGLRPPSIASRLDSPRGSGGITSSAERTITEPAQPGKKLSRATIRNLAQTATVEEIRVAAANAGIAVTSVDITNDTAGGSSMTPTNATQAEIAFATSDGAKVFRRMFHKTDLCGSRIEVAVLP
ncbi:hypothetical protein HDU88_001709 [Geranomyces variabilis]|nr:hypothetical protein HDU88_001709 [Geranomyces variabilis]